MSGPCRLFVGIDLPAPLKARIGQAISEHRVRSAVSPGGRVRWIAASKLHLTLKFLGPTSPEFLPRLTAELQTVAAQVVPGSLRLRAGGAFPSPDRARVLWLGVEDAAGWLARCGDELERRLEPLGFVREERMFAAHLTLARIEGRAPSRLLDPWAQADFGEFTPGELALFESRAAPPRDYAIVAAAPFSTSRTASRSSSPSSGDEHRPG